MQAIFSREDKTDFFLNLIKKSDGPTIRIILESGNDYIKIKTTQLGDRAATIEKKILSATDRNEILKTKAEEILLILCQKEDIDPKFIETLLEELKLKEGEWKFIDLLLDKISDFSDHALKDKNKAEQFIALMQYTKCLPSSLKESMTFF